MKELEGEFTPMLKAYKDKETEFNWEARDKSITRLRGILRGNATEAPYLETLVQYMKQMVDGIIKAVSFFFFFFSKSLISKVIIRLKACVLSLQ